MQLTAGITKASTGIDGIVWNILGQTYVPKSLSESAFSWHATFPPGTFVPPHIHPTQDEFIYMFEGRMDAQIDGRDFVATAGDLIRLPMNIPHGLFNKSDQPVKCLFWVTPTRKLYDLFWAIHGMKEQICRTSSCCRPSTGRVPAAAGCRIRPLPGRRDPQVPCDVLPQGLANDQNSCARRGRGRVGVCVIPFSSAPTSVPRRLGLLLPAGRAAPAPSA
jgi:quercetin dioxygenase-like cupin family protein